MLQLITRCRSNFICNHLQPSATAGSSIHKGFREDVADVADKTQKKFFCSESLNRIRTLAKLYGVSLKRYAVSFKRYTVSLRRYTVSFQRYTVSL
ncbi:MAG: hypothetical protein ACRCX1_01535, partial [Bacteroidales bacterium]